MYKKKKKIEISTEYNATALSMRPFTNDGRGIHIHVPVNVASRYSDIKKKRRKIVSKTNDKHEANEVPM